MMKTAALTVLKGILFQTRMDLALKIKRNKIAFTSERASLEITLAMSQSICSSTTSRECQ